jgi:hypothetical protein
MKQTYLTPVHIKINGKYLFTAEQVEIFQQGPENNAVTPDMKLGQTINLIKTEARSKEEQEDSAQEASKKDYDEFFQKMSKQIDSHEYLHIS